MENREEAPAVEAPLTPEARARRDRRGRPTQPSGELLRCGDAGTWVLARAELAREFDAVRDRIVDDLALSGSVPIADVFLAAWSLIQKHYDLDGREATALLAKADRAHLVDVVVDALTVPADPVRGYSDWVRSGLLANGLDPATVADEGDVRHVLFQLEKTGRVVPLAEFLSVGRRVAAIAALTAGE